MLDDEMKDPLEDLDDALPETDDDGEGSLEEGLVEDESEEE